MSKGYETALPASSRFVLTKPSLILAGRQDTVAGYRDTWMSVERFPRATFATLDGCGHFIAPAKRELFRSLVIDWLERMELDGGE